MEKCGPMRSQIACRNTELKEISVIHCRELTRFEVLRGQDLSKTQKMNSQLQKETQVKMGAETQI